MHSIGRGRFRSTPVVGVWGAVLALVISAGSSAPCPGQALSPSPLSGVDTAQAQPRALPVLPAATFQPHRVRWWEAAALAGGVGALLADDSNVLNEVRQHPTGAAADLAGVFRQAGELKVYSALTLGTLGTGLLSGDPGITRTGAQLAASGALAAASFGLLKMAIGRSRPDGAQGAYDFRPFAGSGSFPSGHTAMAFALATTLGDASHSTWVKTGLYLFATGTAWSRVYDQRHWPSDVLLGAALGVTAAKLVNGRWRLFGLRFPSFLVSPAGAGLQISF
jgi:membrane-associated phospholipid phosphatase